MGMTSLGVTLKSKEAWSGVTAKSRSALKVISHTLTHTHTVYMCCMSALCSLFSDVPQSQPLHPHQSNHCQALPSSPSVGLHPRLLATAGFLGAASLSPAPTPGRCPCRPDPKTQPFRLATSVVGSCSRPAGSSLLPTACRFFHFFCVPFSQFIHFSTIN